MHTQKRLYQQLRARILLFHRMHALFHPHKTDLCKAGPEGIQHKSGQLKAGNTKRNQDQGTTQYHAHHCTDQCTGQTDDQF